LDDEMAFQGKVLALDIASTTGWAYGAPGSVPVCGSHRLAKAGTERGEMYRHFRTWLDFLCSAHPPNLIVYESPAVPMIMQGKTNIDTIKLLTGFAEHLEEWAYQYCELREARVSDVRVHFIGRNMRSVDATPKVMARCEQLGWPVTNHDEGDACALWDYQCGYLRPDLAHKTTPLFQTIGRR
jgi:hypothetical protein